ncbi:MAG: NADPH-dependent FMN reductase [Halobacteriales archaeon]
MTMDTRVIAVCGSLRDDSRTRTALELALAAAEAAGAETELVDLRAYDLPPYGRVTPVGRAGDVPALRETVDAADGILLGTPIYHGSYASPLKTALDYCKREHLRGSTVGLLATAGGRFPTKGLEHLRNVCRHLNAWVVPTEVAIPNASEVIVDGEVVDPSYEDRVRELGRDVTRYAHVECLPELLDRTATSACD